MGFINADNVREEEKHDVVGNFHITHPKYAFELASSQAAARLPWATQSLPSRENRPIVGRAQQVWGRSCVAKLPASLTGPVPSEETFQRRKVSPGQCPWPWRSEITLLLMNQPYPPDVTWPLPIL